MLNLLSSSASLVGRARSGEGTEAAVGGGAATTPSSSFPHLVSRVAAAQVGADSRAGTPWEEFVVLSLPCKTVKCDRKCTRPGVMDLDF